MDYNTLTASRFLTELDGREYFKEEVIEAMIEFAQMHVKLALESVSDKAEEFEERGLLFSVKNCYPLTNIK